MRSVDYAIFFAYLLGILVWGFIRTRRRQSVEDFRVAGRSMKWFPLGASVMATAFCATNFTAFTDEVANHGLYVLMSLPVFFIVAIPVTRVIMPFFHRLSPVSAYAFLETCFDARVRRLASALFIVWRILWMAVAVYATAMLLSRITGIGVYPLIVFIGLISLLHTAAGGLRSVMWSDVLQFAIILGSLAVGVVVAVHSAPGLRGILQANMYAGLLKPFYPFDPAALSFDPRIRISLWSALIGTLVAFLSRYGADQMLVQRYFAARSLADAKAGFWLSVAGSLAALLCLAFLGLAVHAWGAAHELAGGASGPLGLLARFIVSLPGGTCGLLVAGLFASTMSSVDSGIHSCATALATDFHLRRGATGLSTDRLLTVAVATLTVLLACFVGNLGSIFEIANKIINGLGSPLLAIVLIGMFGARRFTAKGRVRGRAGGNTRERRREPVR